MGDSMVIGYARVSTADQQLHSQIDRLREQGAERIYSEHISGGVKAKARPELSACLESLQAGDTLLVTDMDRLGRDSVDVLMTMADLRERNVTLRILSPAIDTSTDLGEAVAGFAVQLAQLERRKIQERTRNGLQAARARGARPGRKPVVTEKKGETIEESYARGESLASIAERVGVAKSTVWRYLRTKDIA